MPPVVQPAWSASITKTGGSTSTKDDHEVIIQNDIWRPGLGDPNNEVNGCERLIIQAIDVGEAIAYTEHYVALPGGPAGALGWVADDVAFNLMKRDMALGLNIGRVLVPLNAIANPTVDPACFAAGGVWCFRPDWGDHNRICRTRPWALATPFGRLIGMSKCKALGCLWHSWTTGTKSAADSLLVLYESRLKLDAVGVKTDYESLESNGPVPRRAR
ncbi:hypothetical protein C8F01DRAFT_1230345 [Mycena amicta]|nr:hypothetical protein C8F01DRAFT_1230345 [Mycena amicta]